MLLLQQQYEGLCKNVMNQKPADIRSVEKKIFFKIDTKINFLDDLLYNVDDVNYCSNFSPLKRLLQYKHNHISLALN